MAVYVVLQRHRCDVRELRESMTDTEYWAHVGESLQRANYDDPPIDDVPDVPIGNPCPVCNATGACDWDSEGRALIHAIPTDLEV